VCFSQGFSIPSDSAATVVTLVGSVSVLRDAEPWALRVGSNVRPGQVVITGPDGYAKFQVADGSEFEVFPNARVQFRANPGDWRDLLDVIIGRIKVHIQKLGGLPNNNRIHTPTAIISVRGTVFDVTVDDGESTLVVVEEGQVEVQHRTIPGSKIRILNPGEWLRVTKDEPLAQKSFDKGSVLRAILRAAADAIYTMPRGGSGGGSTPTSGGGTPGDHEPETPPPPPPPPDSGGGVPPPPAP
jgi:ferric-dicitrate binding protein FerR (iron transport regulator)